MSASEASEQIHLRQIPVRKWILGGLVIVVNLLNTTLLVTNLLQTGANPEDLKSIFHFIVLMVLICASIWFHDSIKAVIYPDVNEVIINPNARFVDLTRYQIYGRRTDRYFFHQIEKIKSQKPKRRFKTKYFAEVILINRTKIYVAIPIGDDKLEVTRLIKKLNKIIRSPSSVAGPMQDWNLG